MLTFKKWTKIAGYAVLLLFFFILSLIFIDIVDKQTTVEKQIVKVENKAQANAVDIWKISYNGKKKYRLTADSMVKKKNGVIVLGNAQLWYFEDKKPDIYIRADKALIYTNNNVYATGNVFLKRKDLRIYGNSVYWDDVKKIAKSGDSFKGKTKRSSFSGASFIYYQKKNKLIVKGDSVWLK